MTIILEILSAMAVSAAVLLVITFVKRLCRGTLARLKKAA